MDRSHGPRGQTSVASRAGIVFESQAREIKHFFLTRVTSGPFLKARIKEALASCCQNPVAAQSGSAVLSAVFWVQSGTSTFFSDVVGYVCWYV